MNNRPLIVYPDADGDEEKLYPSQFSSIRNIADLKVYHGRPGSTEEYADRIKSAQGILLGWDLPGEVMRHAADLEIVSFTGVGASKFVDMDLARDRGITVCNCPGYSDVTVAEHTMALLLSLCRNIPVQDRHTRDGCWKLDLAAMELHGKNIGLIGFGGIGQHFSRLCKAFGMNVYVWTRSMDPEYSNKFGVKLCSLEEIYKCCKIISLHLASNPQTKNIVDQAAFEAMQPGTLFINTARAELVLENAMIHALQTGKLLGAALDVFHEEPLPTGHPLTKMDNVILTPHIGYNTPEAVSRLYKIASDNLVSYFSGQPVNVVS